MRPLGVDGDDAEGSRVGERDVDAGDRHLRPRVDVVVEHPAVVHLVDMVAGEDQHVPRVVPPQDVEVLVDRVRGALVPRRLDPLLRRQQLDELVEAAVEEAPPALHVADEALRLVLRADADPADARVDAVRQREVDDPELAAERDRRLGTPVGQLLETTAPAAGEDQRQRALGQRTRQLPRAPAMGERVEQVRFARDVHPGSGCARRYAVPVGVADGRYARSQASICASASSQSCSSPPGTKPRFSAQVIRRLRDHQLPRVRIDDPALCGQRCGLRR